jgi:hypothetical protein
MMDNLDSKFQDASESRTDGDSNQHKRLKRKAISEEQRRNILAVRAVGACEPCRRRKIKVYIQIMLTTLENQSNADFCGISINSANSAHQIIAAMEIYRPRSLLVLGQVVGKYM